MGSNSTLTFINLPIELGQEICRYLERADLLSLRLLSTYCSTITARSLSLLLRHKLKYLGAVLTRESLRLLLGLVQVKEFRVRIRRVHFKDHRLHSTHWKHSLVNDSMILRTRTESARSSFEKSNEFSALLVDIVQQLSEMPWLEVIQISGKLNSVRSYGAKGLAFQSVVRKFRSRVRFNATEP